MPVFFDHISEQPQQVLEDVCRFIGYDGPVQWAEDLGDQNVSAARLRKSPLRDAAVNFPGMTTLRRTFVPKCVRDRIKDVWSMKERPQISSRKHRFLREIFDADLAVLGGWMGLDLNCDNFCAVARSTSPCWIALPRETAA